MRPQAREATQSCGPGAPVFVCLVVRLRDRESNPYEEKGWSKPKRSLLSRPSPNGRDLERRLDDEPPPPAALGYAGFPCWWSPPPESNRRPTSTMEQELAPPARACGIVTTPCAQATADSDTPRA
jgi:hypothetical protein